MPSTTTTTSGLRTPLATEAPDGPGATTQLAQDVDSYFRVGGAEYAANLAAIQAIPAARLYTGKRAYAADTQWVYRYSGTAWQLWDASNVPTTSYVDAANGSTLDATNALFDLNVIAGVAYWNYNITRSGGISGGTTYAVLKAGWRPTVGIAMVAVTFGGTGVGPANLGSDGTLSLNGTTGSGTVTSFRGLVFWRIAQ